MLLTLVLHGEVGGDQRWHLAPDVGGVQLASSFGLVIFYDLGLSQTWRAQVQLSVLQSFSCPVRELRLDDSLQPASLLGLLFVIVYIGRIFQKQKALSHIQK